MSVHSKTQAQAQVDHLAKLWHKHDTAEDRGDWETAEEAIEQLHEQPLEVSTRSGWHSPGSECEDVEFRIILCTGGPHVEVQGDIGLHGEPTNIKLLGSDWFEGHQREPLDDRQRDALERFTGLFYFGE